MIWGHRRERQCSDVCWVSDFACLFVSTEMMILAGEAIGKWKLRNDEEATNGGCSGNSLRLAFRSQPAPDYRSRGREQRIMEDLLVNNIGDGYCHAWYARRFLSPVSVSELPKAHSGLGLDCYCQWTSPIRRISDLQVHCAIKRYLRRQAVLQLQETGGIVSPEITPLDLGMDMDVVGGGDSDVKERLVEAATADTFDLDIDYSDRSSWSQAARIVQRHSQQYWMLEYIRRLKADDPDREYDVLVLGCTNPSRLQYALYIYELGMEWRYVSPSTSLQAGMRFKVQVGNVLPRLAQLSLVRTGL